MAFSPAEREEFIKQIDVALISDKSAEAINALKIKLRKKNTFGGGKKEMGEVREHLIKRCKEDVSRQALLAPLLRLIDIHTMDYIHRDSGKAFLQNAFQLRDYDAMKLLQTYGTDIDGPVDEDGNTLLHLAMKAGDLQLIQVLTEKLLAYVNVQNKQGATPLHIAAEEGNVAAIRCLMQVKTLYKVEVNALDNDKRTPFHYAAKKNRVDVLKVLQKDYNADLHAVDVGGNNALHFAAMNGHVDAVRFLVEQCEIPVDKENSCRGFMIFCEGVYIRHFAEPARAALKMAVEKGHSETVAYLLTKKPNVMALQGLLHLAARNGHTAICKQLVAAGVNIHDVDYYRKTALQLAAENNHAETVAYLLSLDSTDDINNHPLHWAAFNGYEGLCEQLVAAGEDINASDNIQRTALHWAKTLEVAAYLLAHGANVNRQDSRGCTPLHSVVWDGSIAAVKLFLSHGADVSVQDARGYTPLHRAAQIYEPPLVGVYPYQYVDRGGLAKIKLLLKAGARPNINSFPPSNEEAPAEQDADEGVAAMDAGNENGGEAQVPMDIDGADEGEAAMDAGNENGGEAQVPMEIDDAEPNISNSPPPNEEAAAEQDVGEDEATGTGNENGGEAQAPMDIDDADGSEGQVVEGDNVSEEGSASEEDSVSEEEGESESGDRTALGMASKGSEARKWLKDFSVDPERAEIVRREVCKVLLPAALSENSLVIPPLQAIIAEYMALEGPQIELVEQALLVFAQENASDESADNVIATLEIPDNSRKYWNQLKRWQRYGYQRVVLGVARAMVDKSDAEYEQYLDALLTDYNKKKTAALSTARQGDTGGKEEIKEREEKHSAAPLEEDGIQPAERALEEAAIAVATARQILELKPDKRNQYLAELEKQPLNALPKPSELPDVSFTPAADKAGAVWRFDAYTPAATDKQEIKGSDPDDPVVSEERYGYSDIIVETVRAMFDKSDAEYEQYLDALLTDYNKKKAAASSMARQGDAGGKEEIKEREGKHSAVPLEKGNIQTVENRALVEAAIAVATVRNVMEQKSRSKRTQYLKQLEERSLETLINRLFKPSELFDVSSVQPLSNRSSSSSSSSSQPSTNGKLEVKEREQNHSGSFASFFSFRLVGDDPPVVDSISSSSFSAGSNPVVSLAWWWQLQSSVAPIQAKVKEELKESKQTALGGKGAKKPSALAGGIGSPSAFHQSPRKKRSAEEETQLQRDQTKKNKDPSTTEAEKPQPTTK